MKKIMVIMFVICLLFPSIVQAEIGSKKNTRYIHPTFKTLMLTHPRKAKIVNPMVPRISAEQTYHLYITKQAILFAAGSIARNYNLAGAINIGGKKYKDPAFINKLKQLQKKYPKKLFILFCN